MKVVVINLEKSKDRMDKITKNLNNLKIPFERFNAIDGKNLCKFSIEQSTTLLGRSLLCNHGIIGCAMSHIKIWKAFKESKEDFILISEDDIEYSKRFPKLLNDIDLIYGSINFDILSINCSVGINISLSSDKFIKRYEINKPIFPLTMASYIVSRKGVDKLLKMITKINYHIDFEIAFRGLFNNLEYYNILSPDIVSVTQNADSNISVFNNGILNKLLYYLKFDKINWLISNTAFTLFLNISVSVYACILVIIMIVCLIKRNYKLFSIASIEFILVMTPRK